MNNWKAFRISYALKNTYRVNTILYSLKQIPIIKKFLPTTLYKEPGLKIFANIFSALWEVNMAFLGKLIYFLIVFLLFPNLYEKTNPEFTFHLLILLTAAGCYTNTYIFNPGKDKYYAMFLLRMDAKQYSLVNYGYAILKVFVGYLVFGFIFGPMNGLAWWQCLMIPFFVVGMKFFAVARLISRFEKKGVNTNENKLEKWQWVLTGVLFIAAFVPPFFDFVIPEIVSVNFMAAAIVTGGISLKKIVEYKDYYQTQKLAVHEYFEQMDKAQNVVVDMNRQFISADGDITSNRKGYEYLNDLFVKRHKKILWKSAKRITLGAFLVAVAAIVSLIIFPEAKKEINELVLTFLPYFAFVMYIINRGTGFTQALFMNCDHCLLNYSFYKKPKHILKLFRIRLREIIKINLPPALVIGIGLSIILFVTGGTDNWLNYVVILVSIVCMSMFFSVHYLTVYYLLQPYNAGTEIKSGMYTVINWIVYFVCYIMMQVRLPVMLFGTAAIIFCVLYCVIACILVYKLAWKTFRIRA